MQRATLPTTSATLFLSDTDNYSHTQGTAKLRDRTALFISPIASTNESVEEFLIVTSGRLITSLRLVRLHVLQTQNLSLSSLFVPHLAFLRRRTRGTAYRRQVVISPSRILPRNRIVKCLASLGADCDTARYSTRRVRGWADVRDRETRTFRCAH